MHTRLLREGGLFAGVGCAFLKEEPFIGDALAGIDAERVCVVPDFLAEGYFTRQVIPAMLDLPAGGGRVFCAPPVGTHPLMAELIGRSAAAACGDWNPGETSLLVIGHGSRKNPCSKQTMLRHLHALRRQTPWHQVADLWLEEAPAVAGWHALAGRKQVVVVPFLLSDGQHGGWDIPAELGIRPGRKIHGVTHRLHGRELRLAPALGTSPRFAEAIADLARTWCGGGQKNAPAPHGKPAR